MAINKKVVASIEARMTSSRLPGKVLMEAIDGKPMLQFMVERVKRAKLVDEIVVATTINKADDCVVNLCEKMGIKYFRGSENDVLQRVLEAHTFFNSNLIVELTGDCPLIDPNIIDKVIQVYLNNSFDYVSNSHLRSYPDGLDVQIFSKNILKEISEKKLTEEDREHVSLYIYRSGEYNLGYVKAEGELFWPELRITLDDKGDYEIIKNIITYFYPKKGFDFSALDIVRYLRNNEYLLDLNKDARVKTIQYQKLA
ncbi:TPA: hypothetical protein DEO28_05040 [Candidatus Dependentiae bacterium]|nr:MAG: Cytidylyltransferase [candidate division TM6 bacterium GW2011_GWE2_31_21]KKP53918.1 MAG: Cytidylyltransferase [candidate division TM6 bacterium GW2011_GWF2_33_332]HBS47698.1 hypothetical protein [Candidatus Dependentiae bacterium]HBZ73847.1 hypothetical protein [Candidatus Dependentiae bacterium]